jgi:uncharacterized protein YjiS (DUF1127 family)
MAAFDMTRPTLSRTSFGTVFTNAMGALATWNDARKTRSALSKLSNRELDDIGLTRGDIQDVGYTHLIR